MSALLEKLYTEAMTLPENERLKLACDLLDGTDDGPGDPDADALWDAEIDKRVAEIDAGTVVGLTHEEMMSKIRAKYKWQR